MRPAVHLVIGSTGSGKTTYARRRAAEQKALVFSIDAWMADLFAPDLAGADFAAIQARVERARRRIWAVAAEAAALGLSSMLDIGLLTSASRAAARAEAARLGLACSTHYVAAPAAERWRRVCARNAARDGGYAFEVSRPMFDFVETIWQAPDADERARADFTAIGSEDGI